MSITCHKNQREVFLTKKTKKFALFLILVFLFTLVFTEPVSASNLSGRILLQVEEKGEAWYVNPDNGKRFYLGRPENAFELMKSFGLGVSNKDMGFYQVTKASKRLSGKILLQVQDKGQAFYVNPLDLKLYYLGRPEDAFYIMRSLALGISNQDLYKIESSALNNAQPEPEKEVKKDSFDKNTAFKDFVQTYNFRYKNEDFSLNLDLSTSLYKEYKKSQKSQFYSSDIDVRTKRNSFYSYFLQKKEGDDSIKMLVEKSKDLAEKRNWSKQEQLDFLLSLVQHMPYDHDKVLDGANTNPFFPYETLYLNRGVCSDKSFLAILIAREMGYGAAILDFPEINHSALGLSCDNDLSIRNSGYCYLETTNYFPIGVTPNIISEGEAVSDPDEFENMLNDDLLGDIEIYQKTTGVKHSGVLETKKSLESINKIKKEIAQLNLEIKNNNLELDQQKKELDNLKQEVEASFYLDNSLILEFNDSVSSYNEFLKIQDLKIDEYNDLANEFNFLVKSFYQK